MFAIRDGIRSNSTQFENCDIPYEKQKTCAEAFSLSHTNKIKKSSNENEKSKLFSCFCIYSL
jgi:hypothetical protein